MSTLSLGGNVSVWLFVFVFWPWDELATCPGWSPSLAPRQLGEAPAPPPPRKGEKRACKMDGYVRFVLVVGIGELRVDAMPLQRVMRVNSASIASVQSELFYLLWKLFKWRDNEAPPHLRNT